jgi:hypothetical protein
MSAWLVFSNTERRFVSLGREISAATEDAFSRKEPLYRYSSRDHVFEVRFDAVRSILCQFILSVALSE